MEQKVILKVAKVVTVTLVRKLLKDQFSITSDVMGHHGNHVLYSVWDERCCHS